MENEMETCLTCWHAEDGPNAPAHCGDCPCCKPKPQDDED